MTTQISPLAGKPAPRSTLIDVEKLVTAYFEIRPDPAVTAQRVVFGTSGHRGSAFDGSFNEAHVLAITQAICDFRSAHDISGPLFLGIDTHALSKPACASGLEVLAANGVNVMLATHDEYTPTPATSHAILTYNRGRSVGPADGIVMTPSHNPPRDGGYKYNPPNGGPADQEITDWIEVAANRYLVAELRGVRRLSYDDALHATTTHRHDYLHAYVADLDSVIDMAAIRDAGVRIGVDPLGGAGVHYWAALAEHYKLDLTVVSERVDAQFAFMTVDWDGQIRMDPSSPYAMRRLIDIKDGFQVAFACDTDHDRHGIVTPGSGLLPPNHYLSVAIDYLFRHRPRWGAGAAVDKTVVSTGLILSAEITARVGRDPGALYMDLTKELGNPAADRVQVTATARQRQLLAKLSSHDVKATELAGQNIDRIIDHAPGDDAPIGGIKVSAESDWYATRPSGTENIYKIYAESFLGQDALRQILTEAQATVDAVIRQPGGPSMLESPICNRFR